MAQTARLHTSTLLYVTKIKDVIHVLSVIVVRNADIREYKHNTLS